MRDFRVGYEERDELRKLRLFVMMNDIHSYFHWCQSKRYAHKAFQNGFNNNSFPNLDSSREFDKTQIFDWCEVKTETRQNLGMDNFSNLDVKVTHEKKRHSEI